ncbi:MAG: hypothetical protein M3Q55_13770 [Acidobacteriota bacterium]|nr:hypothetical protein [Acidobacteriota bacterium]
MPLANSKKGARAITQFQEKAVKPALAQLLHNEQIMQANFLAVDDRFASMLEAVAALEAKVSEHRQMTIWQRLVWLLRGAR